MKTTIESTIHRTKIYNLLHAKTGILFTVTFIKKDKSERTLTGMIKPPKLNPKRASIAKPTNSYMQVWDMVAYKIKLKEGYSPDIANNLAYRLVNMSTVLHFSYNGVHYTVVD